MALKPLVFLLAIAVGSCATVSDSSPRKLVGRWRAATGDRTAEYAFAQDGTFTGSVKSGGATLANFTGTWALHGKEIEYRYLSDTAGNIPPGTRDHDTLIAIKHDQFTIAAADGSRRNYIRARE